MSLFDRFRTRTDTTSGLVAIADEARAHKERREADSQSRESRSRARSLPGQFKGEVKRVNKILGLRPQEIEIFEADILAGESLYRAQVTLDDGAVFELSSDAQGKFVTDSVLSVDDVVVGRFSRTYAGDIVLPSRDEVKTELAAALSRQLARPELASLESGLPHPESTSDLGPQAEI